jgi:hypothetical protein
MGRTPPSSNTATARPTAHRAPRADRASSRTPSRRTPDHRSCRSRRASIPIRPTSRAGRRTRLRRRSRSRDGFGHRPSHRPRRAMAPSIGPSTLRRPTPRASHRTASASRDGARRTQSPPSPGNHDPRPPTTRRNCPAPSRNGQGMRPHPPPRRTRPRSLTWINPKNRNAPNRPNRSASSARHPGDSGRNSRSTMHADPGAVNRLTPELE